MKGTANPILWETAVFDADGEVISMNRADTREYAIELHEAAVLWARHHFNNRAEAP